MDLAFNKSTDTKHKVTLPSEIIFAEWRQLSAPIGQKVDFEIGTSFVGQGAPIEIKGKSKKGKNLGKIVGKVRGNKFVGEFTIPADTKIGDLVYFEVKLPKNGLNAESNHIAAVQPIKVYELKWSAQEARRGDLVTLSAKTENISDAAEVKLLIYEKSPDDAHDKMAELPVIVRNNKISTDWEYQYFDDTGKIPTEEDMSHYGKKYAYPEYFFTVKVDNQEFGKTNLDSGLLKFKDWMEITLTDRAGKAMAGEEYKVDLPDGTNREGKLDDNGYAKLEKLPPGKCKVIFKNIRGYELER